MSPDTSLDFAKTDFEEAGRIYKALRTKRDFSQSNPLGIRIDEVFARFDTFGKRWSENVTEDIAGLSAYIVAIRDMGIAVDKRDVNWRSKQNQHEIATNILINHSDLCPVEAACHAFEANCRAKVVNVDLDEKLIKQIVGSFFVMEETTFVEFQRSFIAVMSPGKLNDADATRLKKALLVTLDNVVKGANLNYIDSFSYIALSALPGNADEKEFDSQNFSSSLAKIAESKTEDIPLCLISGAVYATKYIGADAPIKITEFVEKLLPSLYLPEQNLDRRFINEFSDVLSAMVEVDTSLFQGGKKSLKEMSIEVLKNFSKPFPRTLIGIAECGKKLGFLDNEVNDLIRNRMRGTMLKSHHVDRLKAALGD